MNGNPLISHNLDSVPACIRAGICWLEESGIVSIGTWSHELVLTVLCSTNLFVCNYSQTKVPYLTCYETGLDLLEHDTVHFKIVKFCCVKCLCCQNRHAYYGHVVWIWSFSSSFFFLLLPGKFSHDAIRLLWGPPTHTCAIVAPYMTLTNVGATRE